MPTATASTTISTPTLRADHILANPPFNVSDWGGERLRDDKRWEHGVPPVGNANFAWVQHFLHHLAHRGAAGFVLANGSMSSNQSGEGEIRKNIIEAGLVDCIIAIPGQLFRSTQIPACLWFLSRGQRPGPAGRDPIHRRPEVGVHVGPHPHVRYLPRPTPGEATPMNIPTFQASARVPPLEEIPEAGGTGLRGTNAEIVIAFYQKGARSGPHPLTPPAKPRSYPLTTPASPTE